MSLGICSTPTLRRTKTMSFKLSHTTYASENATLGTSALVANCYENRLRGRMRIEDDASARDAVSQTVFVINCASGERRATFEIENCAVLKQLNAICIMNKRNANRISVDWIL